MISWVDDEPHYIQSYIDELELAGYHVDVHTNVDDALEAFERRPEDTELFVVDLMNAPGRTFAASDTKLGRRTGVLLYEALRKISPDLPVVVLTNVSSADLRSRFSSEQRFRWLRKDRCLPFELLGEINDLLNGVIK